MMPRAKPSDDRIGAFALLLLSLYWVLASAWPLASRAVSLSGSLTTAEGIAGRAVVNAGVSSALQGTDFQQGLVGSVVADTAALGANAIGSTYGPTGTDPNAGLQTLSHATLGCAQGALTGGNCASGAAGAAAESVLGHVVSLPADASGAISRTDATLYATGAAALGAVAGQATGGNAQSGADTAINAAANNYLTHNQIVQKQQDLAQALTPEQKAAVNARYNALDAQQQQAAGAQPLGTLLGVQQGLGAPIPGCGVPTNCAADVQQSQQEINGTILLNGGATLPDNGTTLAVISTLGAGPLVRGASAVYNAASNWIGGAGTENIADGNPPTYLARVIPNGIEATSLGAPGALDVFVTTPEAIQGLTASGIAQRLTIPKSPTGFQIFQFPTPEEGLASPILRDNPGFVGGGRTAGGAPEYVIPNGPIPANATKTVVSPLP
jgi:hypothetical protein